MLGESPSSYLSNLARSSFILFPILIKFRTKIDFPQGNGSASVGLSDLKKRGWSLGYVSTPDSRGRMIWIADAHRDDGKRFIVRADEGLTAFLELESAILQPTGSVNHVCNSISVACRFWHFED
jgi:hypothetical protein